LRDGEGSSTALGVSVIRTVHQIVDDSPHILEDPVSQLLLDGATVEQVRRGSEKYRSKEARGLRSHVVLRGRYAEDELRDAVIRGVGQFISLGSGYDTFPYRQPEWAANLQILELDHPATQKDKRAHFVAKGFKDPDNLAFVPTDLEADTLRKDIANAPIDLQKPIWISCLGVFAYLRRQTIHRIFETIIGLPKGSGIVFAFAPDKGLTNGIAGAHTSVADRAAELGEPWLTRFTTEDLKTELEAYGFTEVSFLDPSEAEFRYYRNRTDLPAPRIVRLCKAIV
jgi:methyltransferase (TIGR00027 family)